MLVQEELTQQIVGRAIEVHRELGPGLLESAYEECFCHELHLRGLSFERQANLPVAYKGLNLDCGHRLDLIVENGHRRTEVAREGSCRSPRPAAHIFASERQESRPANQFQRVRTEEWNCKKGFVKHVLRASVSPW